MFAAPLATTFPSRPTAEDLPRFVTEFSPGAAASVAALVRCAPGVRVAPAAKSDVGAVGGVSRPADGPLAPEPPAIRPGVHQSRQVRRARRQRRTGIRHMV